jgi:hypothetical protein
VTNSATINRATSLPLLGAALLACVSHGAGPVITHEPDSKVVVMSDATGSLALRLNYNGRCLLEQVTVGGDDVVSPDTGVCSAIKVAGQWHTTRAGIPSPRVTVAVDNVTVDDIRYGAGSVQVRETWRFAVQRAGILWRIEREYLDGGTLEDTGFPVWDFRGMQTWTGALLGHGGVAWCKLFDKPDASYGVHNGEITCWNRNRRTCLRIVPRAPANDEHVAVRFSRQPGGIFSLYYSVTGAELPTRHGLSRFLHDRQDVWAPFAVARGRVDIEFSLSAFDYDQAFDRGAFASLDSAAIRELCQTIARIGAVDERLHGSNGYYSDVAVLHEPWIAQLGLAIDDPAYFRAYADTLEFQRERALAPDGRVKSRWAGTPGDAIPGSYDANGFYEAQWGYLMDSQPSWVINVAELFDFTGDRTWLARQKTACERALDYLLRRDANGNGLVEMPADSHQDHRGSDWIDVVWAAHENALVNAQMFQALSVWADCEELLGDSANADRFSAAARRLKASFNRPVGEGGFWDPQNKWFVYWRDKDGSVHGNNLVVPVQFSAIGYGLCDDPGRRAAILDRLETLMQQERLFFWPLCVFPYAPGEAHASQYPFPTYENGDLFLAWGELGTRAYAAHQPAVALKYVRSVLAQYARDGLAFQRYLRRSQTGAGADILANNCSIIVGLYRNLCGVQPKHNRLYLEPHLPAELEGTQLKFLLRGQTWVIAPHTNGCRVAVDGVAVRNTKPFAVNVTGEALEYFSGAQKASSLTIARKTGEALEIRVESWPDEHDDDRTRKWVESGAYAARHVVSDLRTNAAYALRFNDAPAKTLHSDSSGRAVFDSATSGTAPLTVELRPQ